MQLNMSYLLKCLYYIPCIFGMHLVYWLENGCYYYLFTMHCIILNNTSNILEDRSRTCRITLELLRNSRLDASSWWVWVDVRLYELCYGIYYWNLWRESGMIVVARDMVYRGRSYRQLDCCSSMDNLGAGLLSTWIYIFYDSNNHG